MGHPRWRNAQSRASDPRTCTRLLATECRIRADIWRNSEIRPSSRRKCASSSPVDDYGVTKAAADLALGALVRRGLRVVRLRPFNHIGTGQTEAFAIPAFAMQIARIEAGLIEPVLRVGNLDAKRDFLDVRDVARVYALTVEHAPEVAQK